MLHSNDPEFGVLRDSEVTQPLSKFEFKHFNVAFMTWFPKMQIKSKNMASSTKSSRFVADNSDKFLYLLYFKESDCEGIFIDEESDLECQLENESSVNLMCILCKRSGMCSEMQ